VWISSTIWLVIQFSKEKMLKSVECQLWLVVVDAISREKMKNNLHNFNSVHMIRVVILLSMVLKKLSLFRSRWSKIEFWYKKIPNLIQLLRASYLTQSTLKLCVNCWLKMEGCTFVLEVFHSSSQYLSCSKLSVCNVISKYFN
jgi:hypothetical protein